MSRINIGCGTTPTDGWLNFDNSLSIRLSASPTLASLLYKARLIKAQQMEFITFCQKHQIAWADATKRIPLGSDTVEVLYSSHMLEHLDRTEARLFLTEAMRVLVPGGIIRLAVPDIERRVKGYLRDGDADVFIDSTTMCVARPRSLTQRLHILLVGTRHHQWMYDGRSLCKLLAASGFAEPTCREPGQTQIPNPGPLDLREREVESVYVEATKP
jgi:SAM-dependent methyltransferase